MLIKRLFTIFLATLLFIALPVCVSYVRADESDDVDELEKQIEKYEKKIAELRGKASTLSNELEYLNSQEALTELRIKNSKAAIAKTEESITKLATDINDLALMVDKISNAMQRQQDLFNAHVRARYKDSEGSPFLFIFGSTTLNELVQKTQYLKVLEAQDTKLINEMKENKKRYDMQKGIFENKKSEEEQLKRRLENEKSSLEVYKSQLDSQQAEKKRLLDATKNDEAKYQELLSQARAEIEGIDAILGGSGIEDSGTKVKAGQRIATVISGSSCNSTGTHLHFSIKKSGSTQNPFNYLKSISNYVNCTGSYCGSRDGDPINPSGDWKWPLSGKITFIQGYGRTWATKYNPWVRRIYTFHDGIDMSSTSLAVYSVADGTYYRGSYTGGGGCQLKYVRVVHKDGLQSYYLHVNY